MERRRRNTGFQPVFRLQTGNPRHTLTGRFAITHSGNLDWGFRRNRPSNEYYSPMILRTTSVMEMTPTG